MGARVLNFVFYVVLAFFVYYVVNNFHDVTVYTTKTVKHVFPKVVNVTSALVIRVQDYCVQDMAKDASKVMSFITKTSKGIVQITTPLVNSLSSKMAEAVIAVHNTAMSYTEDGLNQILGIEDSLGAQQVPASRHKFLSLILLVLWIVTGIVTFTRVSYNKFFLLMSSTFLLHSIFGPVWCMRRLAFVIGLCMWAGSLIANKPIPAAFAVLVLFLLTGLRKWRKRVAKAKSAEDVARFNQTIEQRLESLENKVDVLLAKIEFMIDRVPDRKSCTRA